MLQTYHPDIIGRSITGQRLEFVEKARTTHMMPATEHLHIKVRISHIFLYTFLDRSYKFPVQSISAIDREILFFILNAIIHLTEQSTIR